MEYVHGILATIAWYIHVYPCIISDDKEITEVFNTYFCNITQNLNIKKWEPGKQIDESDPINASVHTLVYLKLNTPTETTAHLSFPMFLMKMLGNKS